jgi:hypothetical protein
MCVIVAQIPEVPRTLAQPALAVVHVSASSWVVKASFARTIAMIYAGIRTAYAHNDRDIAGPQRELYAQDTSYAASHSGAWLRQRT